MHVKVKRLQEEAVVPHKGSAEAAGYDLHAVAVIDSDGDRIETFGECLVRPHATVKFGTGLAMELEFGTFGAIFARSGLATKMGLRPSNCVGVVDSDYRGEVIVAIHNDSEELRTIKFGERIAQLIVMPFYGVIFDEVDKLSDTERGAGGFGSTGKK